MADTQNIEARLAAYVDDEVDAAERAEIEQHLAANPEHRQMLEELKAQRQLIRALPRESAPADVAEALAQQLERAALLGDVDIGAGASDAGLNRWSRWGAIAAVVLLTAGLGMVVYFVLPSPQAPKPQVALVTPEVSDARKPATLDEADRDVALAEPRTRRAAKEGEERRNEDLAKVEGEKSGAAAPTRELAGEAKDKALADADARQLKNQPPITAGVPSGPSVALDAMPTNGFAPMGGGGGGAAGASGMNLLPASDVPAVYVVLKCPDPQAASSRVAAVLASCNLPYQEVPDPTQQPQQQQNGFAMTMPPAGRADFESGRRGGDRIAGKRGYDSLPDSYSGGRYADPATTAPSTEPNNAKNPDGLVSQSGLASRGAISNAGIGNAEVLPQATSASTTAPSAGTVENGRTDDSKLTVSGATQPAQQLVAANEPSPQQAQPSQQQEQPTQQAAKFYSEAQSQQAQQAPQQVRQPATTNGLAGAAGSSGAQTQQAPPLEQGNARVDQLEAMRVRQQQIVQAPGAAAPGTGGGMILVRNVPRRQAAELGAAFSQPELRQVAQVFGLNDRAATATAPAPARKPADVAKQEGQVPAPATPENDAAVRAKLGTDNNATPPTTAPTDDALALKKDIIDRNSDQKVAATATDTTALNRAAATEELAKAQAGETTQPSSSDTDRVDLFIIVRADGEPTPPPAAVAQPAAAPPVTVPIESPTTAPSTAPANAP